MNNMEINQDQILTHSTPTACDNCGGMFFRQVAIFRKVSKILLAAPTDQLLTFPIFRCDDCGVPYGDMINMLDEIDNAKPSESLDSGKSSKLLI
jgi:hypothetical protein